MQRTIFLINGPNLNLLGTRKVEVYGTTTLAELVAMVEAEAALHGFALTAVQSNHEGGLVDAIHAARAGGFGIVINPGAYSHTSVAIRDAIEGVALPTIEVHLSNIYAREPFRRHSFVSEVARGVITGLGPVGYLLAVRALATLGDVR
jgi:3-dehydroquinate dehydratase-2